MLRFFRKLRREFFTKGIFSKYFVYAFGEVILVVFGILIALQVNNSNELAKKKELEIVILEEIKENLIETNEDLVNNIKREYQYLERNHLILDYLDNKRPYNEELDIAFGTYYWTFFTTPITVGYEYLRQNGFNLISNNELRKSISNLVDVKISGIKQNNERWSEHLESYITKPYHVKYFRKYFPEVTNDEGDEYAKPIDYKDLLSNEQFKNINAEIISTRRWSINSLETLQKELKELIEQIQVEIKHLK